MDGTEFFRSSSSLLSRLFDVALDSHNDLFCSGIAGTSLQKVSPKSSLLQKDIVQRWKMGNMLWASALAFSSIGVRAVFYGRSID